MAKMVTRTVKSYCVSCKVYDEENDSVKTDIFLIEYHKDMDLQDMKKALVKEKGVEVIKVISAYVVEVLYGMSEEDFIRNAEVLPSRSVKSEEA